MADEERYPRKLTSQERELLLWVLPEDRPGYRFYRTSVLEWNVASKGRRGEGNYVLAAPGETVDNDSPLPQVVAYGVVQTPSAEIAVVVRERLGNQVEFEITSIHGDSETDFRAIAGRWTFSSWLPGQPCPICSGAPRVVTMNTEGGTAVSLAICPRDKRVWVYNGQTGMNHPVPLTNFYNELMLHKNVRDPRVALDSRRLFSDLSQFTDTDLAKGFASYNTIRSKIPAEQRIRVEEPRPQTFFERLSSFTKRQ